MKRRGRMLAVTSQVNLCTEVSRWSPTPSLARALSMSLRVCLFWIVAPAILLSALGCDAAIDRFPENRLYAAVVSQREGVELAPATADVAAVVQQWFGTPNEPRLPASFPSGLIAEENLARAAGPVSSDQQGVRFGLFRAQCVVCHGVDGGGAGPAAATQHPYPRDFRAGLFKFKSTPRGAKPTHADLEQVLQRGIVGTGMPSFSRLPPEDVTALVDYVIYLAIRGETERRLLDFAVLELGYGEPDLAAEDRLRLDEDGQIADPELAEEVDLVLQKVVQPWLTAEEQVVPLPQSVRSVIEAGGPELAGEAIERGRALFHGPLANCASCHGEAGRGDAVTLDFDDWTKEYSTRLGLAPSDAAALQPLRSAGALPPRTLDPRNLQWGVFRGGDDPATLYRRLVVGIDGTPMPGLIVQPAAGPNGLTPEQVLDLVAYVRSLSGRRPVGQVAVAP